MTIGLIAFVIAGLILLADSLDLLKGSVNWVEMASAFVVFGVALFGVSLPAIKLPARDA